jgi:hypothetical protein
VKDSFGKNGGARGAAPRHQLIVRGNYIVITLSDFESTRLYTYMHADADTHYVCLARSNVTATITHLITRCPVQPENLIRPLITDKCYRRCGLSLAREHSARAFHSAYIWVSDGAHISKNGPHANASAH